MALYGGSGYCLLSERLNGIISSSPSSRQAVPQWDCAVPLADVSSGRYPAYIIYHTDFSSARKEMIKRDMLYSNDEQQIRDLLAAEIADNVKKGWEEV